MKSLLIALMMSSIFVGKMYAFDEVRQYAYVVLWNPDSTYTVFKCADRPMVFPTEEHMVLRVNGTEIQTPDGQVCKFTFSKTPDIETGVANVTSNGLYDIAQDRISISGVKKGVKTASVYAADGKQMLQKKVADGNVALDVSHLKAGIYVVQCGDVKFKFLKK